MPMLQYDPPIEIPPRVQSHYPASLAEVLALAAELEAAGHDPGPGAATAHDLAAAVDAVAGQLGPAAYYRDGLIHLSADEVAHRVRQAGIDVATQETTARVAREFVDQLARDVCASLHEQADTIVASMLPKFTTALAVVRAAAAVGITSTTDPDAVVQTGDAKVMKAFRALPAAVRDLDGIARLRDQLTRMCDVGPWQHPAAAWLATGATLLDLEGLANHDDMVRSRVDYSNPMLPRTVREVVPRTGGHWLSMQLAGYKLQLNTGAEADAVLATARASDAA